MKEDVGTDEQREDLKKQILHAKENNIGHSQMVQMMVVGDLMQLYEMDWLYDETK